MLISLSHGMKLTGKSFPDLMMVMYALCKMILSRSYHVMTMGSCTFQTVRIQEKSTFWKSVSTQTKSVYVWVFMSWIPSLLVLNNLKNSEITNYCLLREDVTHYGRLQEESTKQYHTSEGTERGGKHQGGLKFLLGKSINST